MVNVVREFLAGSDDGLPTFALSLGLAIQAIWLGSMNLRGFYSIMAEVLISEKKE